MKKRGFTPLEIPYFKENYNKNSPSKESRKFLTGFTLIELLVVIAIIGLLSAIIIVSLSTARNKAKNARIIRDLAQVRTIAEFIKNDRTDGYTRLCNGVILDTRLDATWALGTPYGTQISTVVTDVDNNNGAGAVPTCYANADTFCVSVPLNTGVYCISGAGTAGDDTCIAATTTCIY